MKHFEGKKLGVALVLAAATASGQDLESLMDAAKDWGTQAIEEYAPDNLKQTFNRVLQQDWTEVWRSIETALHSDSIGDLAELGGQVDRVLAYLDDVPELAPYADWLRQRADYFDMAEHVAAIFPAEEAPAPPVARPPAAPRRQPPASPATEQKRSQAAQNTSVWKQKLRSRPPPARADALVPTLKDIFTSEGVPPQLVWLAEVESSMNPQARSPVGAAGLFQFMPQTAERFGLAARPEDERLNPEKSAQAAARYLTILYRRFKSWPLALAAYNAGEGRVGKTLKKHGAQTFDQIAAHLPAETRMYVPKIEATISLREGVELESLGAPRQLARGRPASWKANSTAWSGVSATWMAGSGLPFRTTLQVPSPTTGTLRRSAKPISDNVPYSPRTAITA